MLMMLCRGRDRAQSFFLPMRGSINHSSQMVASNASTIGCSTRTPLA